MPKAELHRHLDGSVRPQTLWELSRRHALELGVSTPEELRAKATITTPRRNLEEVLAGFAITQRVLCCYEALERVAFENVEDAFRDGVRLLELRVAPAFIAAGKELGYDEIIEGVLDGVGRGMAVYPIEVGLIGILPRGFPLEENRRATRELLRYAAGGHRGGERICGFDLADAEDTTNPEDFVPFVEAARAAGLGITIHSGENTSARAVELTLDLFKPQRIGHGIRIWGHPRTVERVRRQGVHLEICPTSNWLTRSVPSLDEHPLPHLLHAGVDLSVNSDDPQLFAIDLVHEYRLCLEGFGLSPAQLLELGRAAVRRSFLPREIRSAVLRRDFPPAGPGHEPEEPIERIEDETDEG
ncbi:MAG: adenosine deaminase [Spirochaetales bacterium]|nr:adenosine deaminase [Spirochaetales bacterium]